MPPGINTVDTSLNLVGSGYPNYGLKIAENFLHLLENFSSSFPPSNPIEGQIWYDTTDPFNKVLRVMNGNGWPPVGGIYQSAGAPTLNLKFGDIWVDTNNNRLNIYGPSGWILVGPTVSGSSTGSFPDIIVDINGISHAIIKNLVNGKTLSIISDSQFIPASVISGFTQLTTGTTISSIGTLQGNASSAFGLNIGQTFYPATSFLRKDDTSADGQIISGKLFFVTPSDQIGSLGRDGIVINIGGKSSTDFIQFYKENNNALLVNNALDGSINFKTRSRATNQLKTILWAGPNSVGVNTESPASNVVLDINGAIQVSSTITVLSTITSISAKGQIITEKGVTAYTTSSVEDIVVNGQIYLNKTDLSGNYQTGAVLSPTTATTYDIGTSSLPFRSIYATNIYATNYNALPGTLQLNSTDIAPPGWVTCNGASLSTATYAGLFNAIKYKFGGSGGFFNLPNLSLTSIAGVTTTTYYIIKI
jgi:hypothetical protein